MFRLHSQSMHRMLVLFATVNVVLISTVWSPCVGVRAQSGVTVPSVRDMNTNSPVYILNLLYTDQEDTEDQVEAVREGINAALFAADYTTTAGRRLELFNVSTRFSAAELNTIYTTALHQHEDMLLVLGPYADERVLASVASSVVRENNLICFAPYTGSSAVRFYSENTYFVRAEPRAELLVLVQHILFQLDVRRVGYMFLNGASFGDVEYELLSHTLQHFGKTTPILYNQSRYDTKLNMTMFEEFVAQDPQAIIIFGLPVNATLPFITQCMSDARLANVPLFAPSALQNALLTVYSLLLKDGLIAPRHDTLFTSGTNMLPTETQYHHIRQFNKEMHEYIASGKSAYKDPNVFLTNLNLGEILVSGWITGRILLSVMSHDEWLANRLALRRGLFSQNRYVVDDDFVVGDFGAICSPLAQQQGAMCSCNQGGHTTFLKSIHENLNFSLVPNSFFHYPQTSCYSTTYTLPFAQQILLLNYSDSKLLQATTEHMAFVMQSAVTMNMMDPSQQYRSGVRTVAAQMNNGGAQLARYYHDHYVDLLAGPLVRNTETLKLAVFDPIDLTPHANVFSDTQIHLMPTVEQQLFAAFDFVTRDTVRRPSTARRLHFIMRAVASDDVRAIKTAIESTARTFDVKKQGFDITTTNQALSAVLDGNAINVILGLQGDDVGQLAALLVEHTEACILLFHDDFANYYTTMVQAFTGQPVNVQDRLLAVTSLPLWSDRSEATYAQWPILRDFHAAVTDTTFHTPRGLQAWVTITVANALTTLYTSTERSNLTQAVFLSHSFEVGGMGFGVYTRCDDKESSNTNQACENRNYGATDLVILSLHRALDSSVEVNSGPMTPSMVYATEDKRMLSSNAKIGIIVGSVCAAILLGIFLFLLYRCTMRSNLRAPRRPDRVVTILFTDIESSTALWAALPQDMADAVATHHRLIRRVIAKHKCYEIKTIGDSFMIACPHAYTALQLASDIQTQLLRHNWHTAQIDEAYHTFEHRKAEEEIDYKPPTADLPQERYAAMWNGLRVRIGLNTGLCDIRHDSVTKRYDYYGETVNMAARTEAIGNGGQVVLTESTWYALSTSERESLSCSSLGAQTLRGVPYTVDMYQLDAVPGRGYAALRTEIDAALPEDNEKHSLTGDAPVETLSEIKDSNTTLVASVLNDTFKIFPVMQRVKELKRLLQQWNVSIPPASAVGTADDYVMSVITHLAIKVAKVRQVLLNQETTLSHRASIAHVDARHSQSSNHLLKNPFTTNAMRYLQTDPPYAQRGDKGNLVEKEGSGANKEKIKNNLSLEDNDVQLPQWSNVKHSTIKVGTDAPNLSNQIDREYSQQNDLQQSYASVHAFT